ncbi:actin-like protein, putative [Plasmodium ovale]|uniref:Actin-like protein, putative n=1 Tax=Plasmodium ovale TaxID=36330 RepID=A0A1D3KXH0_PLAOA|nr:actin-like protein, putative [Plasmodium ovale]
MEHEESDENIPVIILDPGSWMVKMGFVKDDLPTLQVPCLYIIKDFSTNEKIVKFGREAIEDYVLIKNGDAKYGKQKVEDGIADGTFVNIRMIFADPRHPSSKNNFLDLLEVYDYLIKKLNVQTCDYNLLVAIPERIEKLYMLNLLKWAFEKQSFFAISFIYNSLAASYYYGLKTVIDMGENGSRITPIAEDHGIFLESIRNCEIGGYLITKYISSFVKINDSNVNSILIQKYKETNTYVSLDIDRNIKIMTECNGLIKPYKIPYTNLYIDPKAEILSHEILFQPEFLAHLPGNFYKQNLISLSQIIFESVCSCPMDLRKQMLNNIVLIGGVSNCINMRERLHKELMNILRIKSYSENTKVYIKHLRMADIASYMGLKKYGKILYYNKKKWVTRQEYHASAKSQILQMLLMWANVL